MHCEKISGPDIVVLKVTHARTASLLVWQSSVQCSGFGRIGTYLRRYSSGRSDGPDEARDLLTTSTTSSTPLKPISFHQPREMYKTIPAKFVHCASLKPALPAFPRWCRSRRLTRFESAKQGRRNEIASCLFCDNRHLFTSQHM